MFQEKEKATLIQGRFRGLQAKRKTNGLAREKARKKEELVQTALGKRRAKGKRYKSPFVMSSVFINVVVHPL
jgi:hypothetical protein